jgi:hypothetical protein
MLTATLSWAQTAALNPGEPICLACGNALNPILARLGSLRCHSCRANTTPLDHALAGPHAREADD